MTRGGIACMRNRPVYVVDSSQGPSKAEPVRLLLLDCWIDQNTSAHLNGPQWNEKSQTKKNKK